MENTVLIKIADQKSVLTLFPKQLPFTFCFWVLKEKMLFLLQKKRKSDYQIFVGKTEYWKKTCFRINENSIMVERNFLNQVWKLLKMH